MALEVRDGNGILVPLKETTDSGEKVPHHRAEQQGPWSVSITGLPGNLTGYAEDTAHSSGHFGLMTLVVRSDAGGSLCGTDGDYAPLQVDANGALRVSGGGGGTEYTEDAASAADPVGQALIGRRRDTLSGSEVSADGDNIALNATAKGELYVKQTDPVPVTSVDLGAKADASATTDTGTFSLISLFKRLLEKATVLVAKITDVETNTDSGAVVGSGAAATAQRVTLASDDPGVANLGATNESAAGSDTATSGLNGLIKRLLQRVTTLLAAIPSALTSAGNFKVSIEEMAGATPYTFLSTAAVLAATIKGSAGKVCSLQFFNAGAAAVHVRLYNQAGSPGTGDGANIVWRGTIPGNTAGAGFTVALPTRTNFSAGIGIRVTGAVGDTDATVLAANEVKGNVQYI